MSTDIFYFSGTGNSLCVAKQLSAKLSDTVRIFPVRNFKDQKKIEIDSDSLIIVFPVYFQDIPRIVKSVIKKLEFKTPSPCIFGVATCNGSPGHSLFTLKRMLNKKDKSLSAGFAITMPGNSLIVYDFTNPPEVRFQRLNDSKQRLDEISGYINNKQSDYIEGSDDFKYHLRGLVTGTVAKFIYKTPAKFRTTGNCSKCMSCIRICPQNNIKMDTEGPKWGRNCEHCLACFHWCPKMAVELGNNTIGKLRYHHPEISINDMYIEETLQRHL